MLNTNYAQCDVKSIELYNDAYAQNYRDYDKTYVQSPDYQHFAPILTDLTIGFDRPIKVLEVGCGTGRYFHVLKNTVELTGIDISQPMLELAANPVNSAQVNIPNINLIAGSVFEHDFGGEQFDLIYSIGVLGEHAPFTKDVSDKIFNLLTDDGKFFFTIVDINERKNFKRKLAETAYPLLPSKIKSVLDKRWETNYMTYDELNRMMFESKYAHYNISSYKANKSGWIGAHLECTASKQDDAFTQPFFV